MKKYLMLGLVLFGTVNAQVLVQYDPLGAQSDLTPIVASSVAASVTVSDLSQNSPDNFGNADVWPVNAPGVLDLNEYLTFTVQPVPGATLDLNNLSYTVRSYFDSNLTLRLRSSTDGFSADIGTANSTFAGVRDWSANFDLSSLPRDILVPVEFRIYPDNAGPAADFADLVSTNAGGTGLQLLGGAPAIPVPSLNTYGLMLMVLLMLGLAGVVVRRMN